MSTLNVNTINAATSGQAVAVDVKNPRSFRNLITNGAMQVAQRSGTAEITAANDTNTFLADRFKFAENTGGSVALSIQDGTGEFAKSLKLRVTGTDTDVYSNDRCSVQTIVEDLDVKHLQWGTANAETVTLSFWIKSNAAQTYCLNVFNAGTNNRTYIAEYTISSANTWEKKTLTIPGDTTGTWNHIGVRWVLMGGSDKVGSAGWGAWSGSGGLEMQTSNQYNWMGATNDIYLTGVQLEVGSYATDFEHRSYTDELLRCQRYCYVDRGSDDYHAVAQGHYNGTTAGIFMIFTPVAMRAAPTVSTPTGTWITSGDAGGLSTSNITGTDNVAETNAFQVRATVSGAQSGEGFLFRSSSAGHSFILDSEL